MKINGLKHLNSNFYDYIMIRNLNLDYIKIDIKNNLKINTVKNNISFYDTIKKLDKKEKLKEIIRYYLRNNKIYSISDKCELSHYDGYFTAVEGSRNLYLQLNENSLDKEILEEIKEKYLKDRCEYVLCNDFDKISISYNNTESSYSFEKYRNDFENVLNINLKVNDKKLLNNEQNFITNYIDYLFSKSNEEIKCKFVGISVYMYKHYDTLKFGEFPGIYICNNDFIIRVNNNIYSIVNELVYKHNKKIEDVKKLQLTINDLQKSK